METHGLNKFRALIKTVDQISMSKTSYTPFIIMLSNGNILAWPQLVKDVVDVSYKLFLIQNIFEILNKIKREKVVPQSVRLMHYKFSAFS